jgi:hypothetical protein
LSSSRYSAFSDSTRASTSRESVGIFQVSLLL